MTGFGCRRNALLKFGTLPHLACQVDTVNTLAELVRGFKKVLCHLCCRYRGLAIVGDRRLRLQHSHTQLL